MATLIQQTAIHLYTEIKREIGDVKTYADKPGIVIFSVILTKAATVVESFKTDGVKLSSAEKQSLAMEIGRLFIIDVKGEESIDLIEYDSLSVPMIDLLINFSNGLVEIAKKNKQQTMFHACMKKIKSKF